MNKKLLSEMIMMFAGCWSRRDSQAPDDRSFFGIKSKQKPRVNQPNFTTELHTANEGVGSNNSSFFEVESFNLSASLTRDWNL